MYFNSVISTKHVRNNPVVHGSRTTSPSVQDCKEVTLTARMLDQAKCSSPSIPSTLASPLILCQDTNPCRSRHFTQFRKLWNSRRSVGQRAETLSLGGGCVGTVAMMQRPEPMADFSLFFLVLRCGLHLACFRRGLMVMLKEGLVASGDPKNTDAVLRSPCYHVLSWNCCPHSFFCC